MGKDGPLVTSIGFRITELSAYYRQLPDSEQLKALDHAPELRNTFWDTADVHADSEDSEVRSWKRREIENPSFSLQSSATSRPEGQHGYQT